MVLQGLKPRIFDRLNKYAGRWVAEVPAMSQMGLYVKNDELFCQTYL